MKKFILPLLILGIVFSSCETEELNTMNALDEVAGKAKINSDDSCTEDENCETAFGRFCPCPELNHCFSDYGINRWGWSVELDRRYGTNSYNLFAGAGQCDWENKGTRVGNVDVTYNEDDGSVEFGTINLLSGYTLKEFHFYAGDDPTPMHKNGKPTVAPGQFYNEGDKDGDGTVYVIVHAVVCGEFEN